MTTPIYENQDFYVPRFEIELEGQNVAESVLRDVIEVTYTDSLEQLDSFEFVLHDWDPVANRPKFSSPYDESNNLRTVGEGANRFDVPVFDPGATMTLRMGYYGSQDPVQMLSGEVVSITSSFPSSGTPTLRVRVLNPLFRLLETKRTMEFENLTDTEIAGEIADELDLTLEYPAGQTQDEPRHELIEFADEFPLNFLMGRARRLGYDVYVYHSDGSDPTLFFGRSDCFNPVYELEWGRTLVSFTPTIKTKEQVTRVVVSGWVPGETGDNRAVQGVATWDQAVPDLPDTHLLEAIGRAIEKREDVVTEEVFENQAEADALALGIMRTNLKSLITGKAVTVGLPQLRAGQSIHIIGVGTRYSGCYLITEAVHKINSGGYSIELSVRMEGGL